MLTILRSVRKTSVAKLANRIRIVMATAKAMFGDVGAAIEAHAEVLRVHGVLRLRGQSAVLDAGGMGEHGFHRKILARELGDDPSRRA